MITRIGIVAGEIWHCLEEKGKVDLSHLLTAIEHPRDVVLMSLGWLAREGHIVLAGEEDYEISLRKSKNRRGLWISGNA